MATAEKKAAWKEHLATLKSEKVAGEANGLDALTKAGKASESECRDAAAYGRDVATVFGEKREIDAHGCSGERTRTFVHCVNNSYNIAMLDACLKS